mmetsp:Transcript_13969/g.25897  ORF Transcript_13969/g.25897 Transcript_13969/m.25897 type:complete len:200 (+) Transcript_13969:164-763(+)
MSYGCTTSVTARRSSARSCYFLPLLFGLFPKKESTTLSGNSLRSDILPPRTTCIFDESLTSTFCAFFLFGISSMGTRPSVTELFGLVSCRTTRKVSRGRLLVESLPEKKSLSNKTFHFSCCCSGIEDTGSFLLRFFLYNSFGTTLRMAFTWFTSFRYLAWQRTGIKPPQFWGSRRKNTISGPNKLSGKQKGVTMPSNGA